MSFFKGIIFRNHAFVRTINGYKCPNAVASLSLSQSHLALYKKSSERSFASNTNLLEKNYHINWKYAFGATLGAATVYLLLNHKEKVKAESAPKEPISPSAGSFKDGLPQYGHDEISKHNTMETRIWITYRFGVYDITDFVSGHPGGKQILEAAGGGVEPFWDLYQQHNTPEVSNILEEYRIGNYKEGAVIEASDDFWVHEPQRDSRLIARSLRPCNAETPKDVLAKNFITDGNIFYVRHHLPVPEVNLKDYSIVIKSEKCGEKTLKLSINDIKKFPKHTVTAALMCAGNRRSQMNNFKATKGLNWGPGAIGNAVWAGARLKDILEAAGVKTDDVRHVQFTGLDIDINGNPYGASIPLANAMDERKDIIIAYEMNGKAIPLDHGFPLRAFIPGTVGARCVKWLSGITISDNESPSHWQQLDYKGFNPSVDPNPEEYGKSTSIQHLPVTSAILSPSNGTAVDAKNGFVEVKGYAWSGGGEKIIRVDLTNDKGKTWMVASIIKQDSAPAGRHWAWTMWTAKIPVKKGQNEVEIWVKAIDSSYNSQPDNVENIWNMRGVLNNSFDKIKIKIN